MNTNIYYIDKDKYCENFIPGFMQSMDISIKNGDLETGDTDEQDMFFILQASPGNFYFAPRIGYNIQSKLSDNISKVEEIKKITEQLERDNFVVEQVNIITLSDLNKITDAEVRSILIENKVIFNIKAKKR